MEMIYINVGIGAVFGAMTTLAVQQLYRGIKIKTTTVNKLSCPECKSKKVVPIADEPGNYFCQKCHTMLETTNTNLPQKQPIAPVQPNKPSNKQNFECKHCGQSFPTESRLRRHIGMKHWKELSI